jgi:hypothetical protein
MTSKCSSDRQKIRYRNELDAKIALWSTSRRDRDECRYYRCPRCGGFHLTSKGKRR